MSSDEEALAAQYARRQELLKQLNEVNSAIRSLEQKISEKTAQNVEKKSMDAATGGDTEMEKLDCLLDRCVRDSNGLRDAMKFVDACKALRENAAEEESSKEKHLFCNRFVHKVIARSPVLATDPNGSELIQNTLGLLKNGGSVSPALHSTDYIADRASDLSEILLLLGEIKGHIPRICYDTNGTRFTQKLFDYVKSVEELEFCAECFSDSIIPLCKDINGSHSVARLLAAARQSNFSDENGKVDAATEEKLSGIHKMLYKTLRKIALMFAGIVRGAALFKSVFNGHPSRIFP
ncbi:putative pumilio/PUF RNA binding protein 1 [Trypanosoma cruzi]|uniref:Putative pumilio/PUF RNA binding protein 1 n=1 Tax=Trypanosoma cruzi TaxID=5693 RepID=A0A2V2XI80_TRYCR|nr:putative pumilio/PUF RNA binding protein 1 [Trypanosoma cruzi]